MKKLYLLFALTAISPLAAQDLDMQMPAPAVTANLSENFRLDFVWRVYYILPQPFGNHALADAHGKSYGVGTSFGLVEYQNFRLGMGMEFDQYSVSDIAKVGDFKKSNGTHFFGALSYDFEINDTFLLQPIISFGSQRFHQKKDSQSLGSYSGNQFRMGVLTDVQLADDLAVFVGVQYIHSSFDIATNPEFESYFQKSQQIQLTLGLKIF